MPVVVFLAVMFATIGLAFILENAKAASAGALATPSMPGPRYATPSHEDRALRTTYRLEP